MHLISNPGIVNISFKAQESSEAMSEKKNVSVYAYFKNMQILCNLGEVLGSFLFIFESLT